MAKPFHLSFVVPDLEAATSFYISVLGCGIGRDAGAWVDILLFGHQLTIHQEQDNLVAVAIDHFGPVLSKSEWLALSERVTSHQVNFQVPPQVKNEGAEGETGKFILSDPAGNNLEFKYYKNFKGTVGEADV
ncbi:MAG: VOC family protein [Wenzhouxiangellaceae bacterium]